MIATAAILCIMCKHAKLKALLTGIAFQPIKETDAIFGCENEHCTMVHNSSTSINDYRHYAFHFGNYKKVQNI